MANRSIDLNADVGEASDPEGIERERALLALVTSANVACGGHAGDEASMTDTVAAALAHSVRVGAHPSYPDRPGFGRRADADRPWRTAARRLPISCDRSRSCAEPPAPPSSR